MAPTEGERWKKGHRLSKAEGKGGHPLASRHMGRWGPQAQAPKHASGPHKLPAFTGFVSLPLAPSLSLSLPHLKTEHRQRWSPPPPTNRIKRTRLCAVYHRRQPLSLALYISFSLLPSIHVTFCVSGFVSEALEPRPPSLSLCAAVRAYQSQEDSAERDRD